MKVRVLGDEVRAMSEEVMRVTNTGEVTMQVRVKGEEARMVSDEVSDEVGEVGEGEELGEEVRTVKEEVFAWDDDGGGDDDGGAAAAVEGERGRVQVQHLAPVVVKNEVVKEEDEVEDVADSSSEPGTARSSPRWKREGSSDLLKVYQSPNGHNKILEIRIHLTRLPRSVSELLQCRASSTSLGTHPPQCRSVSIKRGHKLGAEEKRRRLREKQSRPLQPAAEHREGNKKKWGSFVCATCGKTYRYAGGLRRHQLSHAPAGERSFECGKCGKAFGSQWAAVRHERNHAAERVFRCPACPRTFTQPDSLARHGAVHTGTRAYACHLCPKAYTQSATLHKHLRWHSGARPFVCGRCGRTFARSDVLAKHARTHTGERPYLCHECGLPFARAFTLDEHVKRMHPQPRPEFEQRTRGQDGAKRLRGKARQQRDGVDARKRETRVRGETAGNERGDGGMGLEDHREGECGDAGRCGNGRP
ncbi:uncharacterized protein LOC144947588 isoform X1 [Lampetra fluviatilis]